MDPYFNYLFGNREKSWSVQRMRLYVLESHDKKEIPIRISHYRPKLILDGNVKLKGKTTKTLEDNIRYLTFEYRYFFEIRNTQHVP